MVKNRNSSKSKKIKNGGPAPMDLTTDYKVVSDAPQAMDTSESTGPRVSSGGSTGKIKGIQMKRAKNVRKKKAIAKAISRSEQSETKVSKTESKMERIKSAKKLYD